MDMVDFFSLVWPATGYKYVATHNKYFKHYPVQTPEEAAKLAAKLDAADQGAVYFSCAAYAQANYVDAEGEIKWRTQDNASGARCFWQDLDVGPSTNKFPTQAAAIEKLNGFIEATGLPAPLLVSSGGGVHVYWPLEVEVDKATWVKVATAMRRLMRHHGMKSDPSRDKDIASVLRPVGTTNRKNPEAPRRVQILAHGDGPTDPQDFIKRVVGQYRTIADLPEVQAAAEDTVPAHLRGITATSAFSAGIGDREFPPASARLVAKHCAQLKLFFTTGGDTEPTWRNCGGIIKHCVEGEALFHEISSQHPDYSQRETQKKLDGWKLGPSTCESFANHNDLCTKCPHAAKTKSPIQLGEIPLEAPTTVTLEAEEEEGSSGDDEPATVAETITLPLRYTEQGGALFQQVIKDGKAETRKVCDMLFYPAERIGSHNGMMTLEIRARVRKLSPGSSHWEWKVFALPCGLVGASGAELSRALADFEIVEAPEAQKGAIGMYLKAFMDDLRKKREEVKAATTFGWQGKEEFVLGEVSYGKGRAPQPVRLGGTLAPGYGKAFEKANQGSAEEWARHIEAMYSTPGHEQYQFVLAVCMASPLVEMLGIEMGAPVNLYGQRGKGKTTVCQVGLSVWGDPRQMQIADPKEGTTSNALYARLSTMHNIPTLIDEVTQLDGKELGTMAYHVCNAKPKDTLDQNRRRREPIPPWYSMTLMTSNDSAQEKISGEKADASAQLSRMFEIEWSGDVETITPYKMNDLLYTLEEHYGTVGPRLAQYWLDHYEEVRQLLMSTREKMDKVLRIGKEHRFWSIQIAATITGAIIAKRLGFFPFDLKALVAWLQVQAQRNVFGLAERVSSMDDVIHMMVTALSNRTITTSDDVASVNGGRLDVRLNEAPAARVLLARGIAYYDVMSVKQWCTKRSVNYSMLRRHLQNEKVLIDDARRYSLGKGTTVTSGQSRCWVLDFAKLMGAERTAGDMEVPSYLKVVK